MSDDATTDVIDEQVAAAATHGSFCPKMCTFACPVTAATGRDDAVPWSLHRTVADLADGRLPLADDDGEVFARLTACTGCLGCQVPCTFDQDVPAQVRPRRRPAGRPRARAPVPRRPLRPSTTSRRAAAPTMGPHRRPDRPLRPTRPCC